MMRRIAIMAIMMGMWMHAVAQRVTITADNEPAAQVFRSLVEQTGRNFVYSSELLENLQVSVNAKDKPLKKVLDEIFADTDIAYKIKGKNVMLKRVPKKKTVKKRVAVRPNIKAEETVIEMPEELGEVIVVSRLEAPAVETAEIGARKVTADEVRNAPALFGESDVIKTLHMEPGVTEGNEGMAGMNVHGGDADGNLYMLDNVPIYQVNHFAGLFSAFNTDIIRYIDFFKSSMPAKYDGRLSSFMDVRLQNGNREGHHGSARLGLTSGAFNISGPIGGKTTYLVGLRRSWYEVLSLPILAIANSGDEDKTRFNYYFMDLNAKVTHRFSERATGFVSVYFGDDMLKTGTKESMDYGESGWRDNDNYNFHWGNLVAQAGLNHRISPVMTAEYTAAYTRYFSDMRHHDVTDYRIGQTMNRTEEDVRTDNNINDWIFRGDFDWQPTDNSRARFGANYIRHSFLPTRTIRRYVTENGEKESCDPTWAYGANEVNAYVEEEWRINNRWQMNGGVHVSLFDIDGKVKHGVSPRLSVSYRPTGRLAVKGAYSRTIQYVHQLTQGYLALPTDQWIPVTGDFRPQSADKIAVGGYWQTENGMFAVAVEGYYKWMRNLIEYRDEYYLRPPMEMWNARLTTGSGTAKGVDVKIEKVLGKLTGHIAYSLGWADRRFAEKNGGERYPARFDNRHTINLLVSWQINDRVHVSASWTGHSGNRFTLLPQVWEVPSFGSDYGYVDDEAPLRGKLNNYQLPFYHRLDLSCRVRNSRGYWTFGLYNAYNHMNTIAVRRGWKEGVEMLPDGMAYTSRPVFQKVKLLPIIPSISYTWQF